VEGSTRLLQKLGPDAYAEALAEHRRVLRKAFAEHGGVEVDTQGDSFFVAFPTAPAAVAAAEQAQAALRSGAVRVRMGLHTGTPLLTAEGYVGADVHRAARIAELGSGDQILLSRGTRELVDAEVRDLGEHRLEDLSTPERIFQLGTRGFPRLKTLYQSNLPTPPTPLIGRMRELAEVTALLGDGAVRLLTLTGAGGTGKTRLALAAAAHSADTFPDGTWWVPLASVRDPMFVLDQARHALGLAGELADQLSDRRSLILFDNFEQVSAAAVDLSRLLARCPNLRLLVTSREPLRLGAEREYAVPALTEQEATELFSARDPSRDDRMVIRPARAPRATAVRAFGGLRRRLHNCRRRRSHQRGPRHLAVAGREEPAAPRIRALLDARDYPGVRGGTPWGRRSWAPAARPARRMVHALCSRG
jgi:hypothetical protein